MSNQPAYSSHTFEHTFAGVQVMSDERGEAGYGAAQAGLLPMLTRAELHRSHALLNCLMVCVSTGIAGVGVSELSNGDTIRADRDTRKALLFSIWFRPDWALASVGHARAVRMADANFDAQRGVQLSGWLKLHGTGTPEGANHLSITPAAKMSWTVRSASLTWSCGHWVPYGIRAPYESCLVCRV